SQTSLERAGPDLTQLQPLPLHDALPIYLVRLHIDEEWKERVRSSIPELPDARRDRYMREYGLSAYDAGLLTAVKAIADFFDGAVQAGADPKGAANWITGELLGYLNATGKELKETRITPAGLAGMLGL